MGKPGLVDIRPSTREFIFTIETTGRDGWPAHPCLGALLIRVLVLLFVSAGVLSPEEICLTAIKIMREKLEWVHDTLISIKDKNMVR